MTEISSYFLFLYANNYGPTSHLSIYMNLGNFIYIFPNDYQRTDIKSLKVYLNIMGSSKYRFIGYNYNIKEQDNYVYCNKGVLEFDWYEPWDKLKFIIENCKTKFYNSTTKKSSYKFIKKKDYYSNNQNYTKNCNFSYNVLYNLPCEYKTSTKAMTTKLMNRTQTTVTKTLSILNRNTFESTANNFESTAKTSGSTANTNIVKNTSESTTNNLESTAKTLESTSNRNIVKNTLESTAKTLESTKKSQTISQITVITTNFKIATTTSQLYVNEIINLSKSPHSKWLVIGLPVAFIVIFAILIPLFGFLYKLRQQEQNMQSETLYLSYYTNNGLNEKSSIGFTTSSKSSLE